MGIISFRSTGSTSKMESFLRRSQSLDIRSIVEPYAQEGVAALRAATPVDSGLAASSWGYRIESTRDTVKIVWTNTNIENGFPVAVMLQYGYGTGTGGYVQGRDYINPAVRPIFDKIADGVWRVVTSA
jgi:hypothetical protein